MQTTIGVIAILTSMLWGCYHLAEMLGLFETLDGDKIDRCPHCGDWTRHGEELYVDDNEIYHAYCWDKTRGQLKGVLHASQ